MRAYQRVLINLEVINLNIFFVLILTTQAAWVLLCSCNSDQYSVVGAPVNNGTSGEASIQLPSFPGGIVAFDSYCVKHVKYPEECAEMGLYGKVVISFFIEKDGSVKKAKVERSVYPSLDNEFLRIIKTMPRWIPAKQNGKPIRYKIYMPLRVCFR